MDSIQKVMQYFRENKKYPEVVAGYKGTLIENFECDKTFFTCVEVTAGSRWVGELLSTPPPTPPTRATTLYLVPMEQYTTGHW